jgi:hypothetical protein
VPKGVNVVEFEPMIIFHFFLRHLKYYPSPSPSTVLESIVSPSLPISMDFHIYLGYLSTLNNIKFLIKYDRKNIKV